MNDSNYSLKDSVKEPFIELLAYAIRAHEANGSRYIKAMYDTNSRSVSNISIFKKILSLAKKDLSSLPTDKEIELAKTINEHIEQYFMDSIKDPNGFKHQVLTLSNKTIIRPTDYGLLCYIPELYKNDINDENAADSISNTVNAALGEVNAKLSLTINVVKVDYLESFGSYRIFAVTSDNHAVMFYNKEGKEEFSGNDVKIVARVKSIIKDKNGSLVTCLYYIKKSK
jgi:hypothetical protein